MYGCFTPVIVYGILELNDDKLLSDQLLVKYNLRWYATKVIRTYAVGIIYGIATEEFGEPTDEEKETVQKFVSFLQDHGIPYQEPQQYLGLRGDTETDREEVFDL